MNSNPSADDDKDLEQSHGKTQILSLEVPLFLVNQTTR